MISIEFAEPDTEEWRKWRERCAAEQRLLNESHSRGKPKLISKKLYKAQRRYYLGLHSPFHGKCAYCETLIAENQSGDLDHFRPKGRVTQFSQRVDVVDEAGSKVSHPGYYWLAYDCRNLLPACVDCNRPSTGKSLNKLIGKWDEFPVRGFRASRPGAESKENPLLLNPTTVSKVEKHLAVDDRGVMSHSSKKGEISCDIFGLNRREALIQRRIQAYREGYNAVSLWLLALLNDNNSEAEFNLATIECYEAGINPYSAAGRLGIDHRSRKLAPAMKKLWSRRKRNALGGKTR